MEVSVGKITETINRISNITSGDKQIPGVLLDLSENLMKVCYSDGHKSFIEHLTVETDDTDKMGAVVVDFSQIKRAIDNCQPSGIIKVDKIRFEYKDNVITIVADQMLEEQDENGNVANARKLAQKSMDVHWVEPGSNMRSAILTRMKYEDIFVSESDDDELDTKELLDSLNRTSIEKGKQIYMSTKTQTIFVMNQAHLTSVPISKAKTLTQEEMDEIRATLNEAGTFTEESFQEEIKKAENRLHYAVVMNQQIAKSIIGVFSKISADNIYMHTKEKFCSMFVDTEDEHIGFWFEMPPASKAHIGSLERYNALEYKSYQTKFIREFLANSIKSALNSTKNEKVGFKFERNSDGQLELVIAAGSAQASIADTYRIVVEDIADPANDIESKTFTVSLSVFSAMLDQLKTAHVALDFNCAQDGSTCIRLAEIDYTKMADEYMKARAKTEELCKQQGIPFDSNTTPTPVEIKLDSRLNTLEVKQFTMLSK